MKQGLIAIIIFIGSFIQSKSQSKQFEKIEYVTFDVNSYRTNVKDSVFVGLYCSILQTGVIEIYNPHDLRDQPAGP